MTDAIAVPLPSLEALESRLPASAGSDPAVPLYLVGAPDRLPDVEGVSGTLLGAWAATSGFEAKPGQLLVVPHPQTGDRAAVLVGSEMGDDGKAMPGMGLGALPGLLPKGTYHLQTPLGDAELSLSAYLLGGYRYSLASSRGDADAGVCLICDAPERERVLKRAQGSLFGRDLINTPANRLGPDALTLSAQGLADAFGAQCTVIEGDALLDPANPFQMVHTVGAAAAQAPKLIDIRWRGSVGGDDSPKLTLVGKGVCFDSGGLNIKPGNAMAMMKKDMGGAAAVLGLALMIMQSDLPVQLRVLVPAVENAIASDAFRPGDVLESRKGLTVEVGNTDAEGRLVLGDALALAVEEDPDLLIDMATLTGAARVALGPDLPPFFTDDEALAAEISEASQRVQDPVWRMPLWPAYDKAIAGKVADISNTGSMPFAGAITAALFLRRFAEGARSWVHFDIYGWNPSPKPGRPEGGDPQAIRALFNLIERRYAGSD